MKILLSNIKKYLKIKIKKNYIYKIFNILGIEIIKIKSIYPINYYKNNNNKKIFLVKIIFIIKVNNIYYFLINLNKIVKSLFFLKKNTFILINSKNKILFDQYYKDYFIDIKLTPNINYLSYYLNLSNQIISYLTYKNLNINNKYLETNYKGLFSVKKKKQKIKINLLYTKNIIYFKIFYIKNIKNIFNFNIYNTYVLLNKRNKKKININNYINFLIKEFGIPIIPIDYDKINPKEILININNKNIKFSYNKNNIIKLNKKFKDILLYNKDLIINLNGIINNNYYEVTNKTKKILLLIYILNHKKILKTTNLYNINNNLSNIYKNKVNLNNINYLINKLKKIFKNNISLLYKYYNTYLLKGYKKKIKISFNYINKYIGIKISRKKILKILKAFNYKYTFINKDIIKISFINDLYINNKIDIINNIIKFLNLNKLPCTKILLKIDQKQILPPSFNIIEYIKKILIFFGFYEVINTPFLKKKKKIKNIIKINNIYLRNKIFYSLLKNIYYNYNRKFYNLKFFEVGNCYKVKNNINKEEHRIEILITKKKNTNLIKNYYKYYNIIKIILKKIGIINYKKRIINKKKIILIKHKKKIVIFDLIKNNNLNIYFYYIIIKIENIINFLKKKKIIKYKNYSKFNNIEKDLTFIINKNIYFNKFYKITKKILKKKLIKLKLFDIYTKNLPKNKKSYTLRFIIKNKFGLRKQKIKKILQKLIYNFKIKLNAILKK
ncbi:MAG: phenylalanine--tRNA ligase beta subunit-related protein [Candidatus Shikimatogenerans bostrichidophilus]|nr:MAG: phenylalanine--tRNA ligase beta subunit-related protein [Candidatus Shikimatogenerans bostrichidophilus]